MVDRFSKIVYYIPITMNISNRGSQFVLNFIKKLCNQLKIEQNLSIAYYSQTDGQTERVNQEIE